MKAGLFLAALTLGLGACADAKASELDAELRLAHDSDSFSGRIGTLGWTSGSGFGIKAGVLRYAAPGWHADGHTVQATYRRHREGSRLALSAGVAELGGFTHRVATLDVLQQVSAHSALGLSAERSYVDSIQGIAQGVHATHVVGVGEHRFGPRLDLGLAAGATRFSDGNLRRLLRTRWNLALAADGGLHLYLKTRNYRNSDPYRPAYFSPERLDEASLGLSARFAVADLLVASAQADAGRQRTEFSSQPLWSYSLGLSSPRSSRLSWRIALQATNAASSSASPTGYRHASLIAQLAVPF